MEAENEGPISTPQHRLRQAAVLRVGESLGREGDALQHAEPCQDAWEPRPSQSRIRGHAVSGAPAPRHPAYEVAVAGEPEQPAALAEPVWVVRVARIVRA